VKSAADTFRPNPDVDVASAITELKVGEALVSLLLPDGSPSPVERVLIRPPSTRVGPLTPDERRTFVTTDAIGARYDQAIDRDSAEEILKAKAGEAAAAAEAVRADKEEAKAAALQAKEDARLAREQARADALAARETERQRKEAEREAARQAREAARPTMFDKAVQSAARSAASSVGRQIGSRLLRGILGGLLK
jgi:hypothetical protein